MLVVNHRALVLAVLGGCSPGADEPSPSFESLGLQTRAVRFLEFDAEGREVAVLRRQIVRRSAARDEWGVVGLGGRERAFMPLPVAVATTGDIFAVGDRHQPLYVLAEGGGAWEPSLQGLPPAVRIRQIAADRSGAVYLTTSGEPLPDATEPVALYRFPPNGTAWQLVSDHPSTGCPMVLTALDNVYFNCAQVTKLAPGASTPEPVTSLPPQAYVVAEDASGFIACVSRTSCGRVERTSSELTPFPGFGVNDFARDYEAWPVSNDGNLPGPIGLAPDGSVYAAAREPTSGYIDVFRHRAGDATWTNLGGRFDVNGRQFTMSPAGDVYSFAESAPLGMFILQGAE